MKKYLTLLFLFFLHYSTSAQNTFGNEWIKDNQKYLKIKTSEDGIYRISYTQLTAAGFLAGNPNPKNFQLFYNGIEIPIYIEGENNLLFDDGEFIEFRGKRNDGKLDEILYPAGLQPNTEVSLYSNEACYFLTIGTAEGKRYINTSVTNSSLNAEQFIIYTSSINFTDAYYPGKYQTHTMSLSEYQEGEGFMGNLYGIGTTQSHSLSTPNAFNTNNFTPTLSYYVAGRSNATSTDPNENNHHLQIGINNNILTDVLFRGYNISKATLNLNYNLINNSTTIKFSSIPDLGALTDFQAISYARITYARHLDGSDVGYLPFKVFGNNNEVLLNFTNTNWNEAYILDEANGLRYIGTRIGSTTSFVAKNPGTNQLLHLYNKNAYKTPIIENVSFNLVKANNYNEKLIILTHRNLLDAANEYAAYKVSKGYTTLVVTTEDLYNQFYYGQHHPLAIKNMARYLLGNATNKPEYLLLLGKGYETPKFKLDEDLVPTLGFPASDSYLTSEIIDNNLAPALATGRVPAKTNEEVRIYLNKLKSYDLQPDSIWRKHIINISGGKDDDEHIAFSGYLRSFSNIAAKEYFGAKTISFYKRSTDAVTENLVGKISSHINDGASLLTYLGHGSNTTTAVSVGSPSYLNNKEKLLFYLINGCSTGNAFTSGSMGESYIFQPEKGAIGWIGTSSEGIASYLSSFTTLFYQNSFHSNYGSSVAKNMQRSTRSFVNINDSLNKIHTRQYIYLGDPTIGFYAPDKPDYEITPQSIGLMGNNINAGNTSLRLFVIIKNLRKAVNQNIEVALTRTLPDNTVINLPIKLATAIYHTDTLYFDMDNSMANVAGNNKFSVTIDPNNAIQELSKTNNKADLTYYLAPNGLNIISPANFSIAGNTDITLKVQSNDFLAESIDYIFEIDTLKDFSSNWKKNSGNINSDSFASWKPKFLPEENKVYYWRAKLANANNGEWQTSSFTYINNSMPGFNQGHFQQFENISLYHILKDNNTYKYAPQPFPVLIRTRGNDAPNSTERRIRISPSGGAISFISEFNGISLIALNPDNLFDVVKYESPFNHNGQFYFDTNSTLETDSLLAHLNKIPNGYYVVGMSGVNFNPNALPNAVKSALQNIGLTNFVNVNNGEPYAFWGRKGTLPGTAIEKTAEHSSGIPANQQIIDFTQDLPTPGEKGYYLSEKIGPSRKWSEVAFNLNKEDTDEINYTVIGVKEDGTEVTTRHNQLTSNNFSIADLSADEYPFIRLKVNATNTTTKNLAQLKSWKVIYDGFADISFNPNFAKNFYKSVLQEGDSLKLSIGLSNLETAISDSVQVTYKITKSDRSIISGKIETTAPISINNSHKLDFKHATIGLSGANALLITATPKNKKDKNEFNNYLTYVFDVQNDKKEPLIEVLFDNKQIINGEIVSPKPQIQISVRDENKFLLLKDTSNLELYIKENSEQNFKRIAFSSNKVNIQRTGTSNNNKIDFLYLPETLQDGIYTLKLRSKDASGNYNQTGDYTISFEVINEQTISNFLPYPNPFTTAMKFVFQVTGKVPDNIKIQIMTVSGKIVREVLKNELGPIQMGNNISTFTWDGNDQFGDRLANGVYFYNVSIENNDKSEIKHRTNNTDKFFKKNFGKIYLMR